MEKVSVTYVYEDVVSREHILHHIRQSMDSHQQPTSITVTFTDYVDRTVLEASADEANLAIIEGFVNKGHAEH